MIAWFFTTYKRDITIESPTRYCAMNDFSSLIFADGGYFQETEVLGNYSIVKVRASETTINLIASTPVFIRLPKDSLDDPLSDLTSSQLTGIRNQLENMGYTLTEIQARFGNRIGDYTLRD